jgi:hypothetical protein
MDNRTEGYVKQPEIQRPRLWRQCRRCCLKAGRGAIASGISTVVYGTPENPGPWSIGLLSILPFDDIFI